MKKSVVTPPAYEIVGSMKLSSWGWRGNAYRDGRRVGSRRFHAASRLPFADKSRRITGGAAIRHDQYLVFATADRAISRRQAIGANDAYCRAGRSLKTLGTRWPGWALRSRRAWRTGVPLRAGRTARTRITLRALPTIGEAKSQSPHNNKMRCPHDCAPFVRPSSCAFADCAPRLEPNFLM